VGRGLWGAGAGDAEPEVQMFESHGRKGSELGRRAFIATSGAAVVGFAMWAYQRSDPARVEAAPDKPPKRVTIVEFTDAGERKGVVTEPMVRKTEAEWKAQLSPDAFEITRSAGTERPLSGELLNVHDKGVFRCICCDNALYSSATKFESGTGWPSFWAPIAKENVLEAIDMSLGEMRTEVRCRLCDAHLGHVFNDGPDPTGLRYCMNSVAMRFAKAV
jgi:peptide-methionine (R)-S-oxide reductase